MSKINVETLLLNTNKINGYLVKDAEKFKVIDRFIGRGSPSSSTHRYAKILNRIANTGDYNDESIVGVSVEGNRADRVPFDKREVNLAILSSCTFVTDNELNRSRDYNIGERELAEYLTNNGYYPIDCIKRALWLPLDGFENNEELRIDEY